MKKSLTSTGYDFYQNRDTPDDLAHKVLNKHYKNKLTFSDLPINPFKILKSSGATYTFIDFDEFEGFYLLYNEAGDMYQTPVVGIKQEARITRQRFSAAHELCHHIKDRETAFSKQGDGSEIEVFANKFASELLMPRYLLSEMIKKIDLNINLETEVFMDKILEISAEFGVSFHAASIAVNSVIRKFSNPELTKHRKNYKPEKKREKYIHKDYLCYRQAFDDIDFLEWKLDSKTKNDFLRLIITSDHRMESGTLSIEQISEIIAEFRYNDSNYELLKMKGINDNDVEVLGQYAMYEMVFVNFKKVFNEIIMMHKAFYKFAPHPDAGGSFRETNTRLNNRQVKLYESSQIASGVMNLANSFQSLIDKPSGQGNAHLLDRIIEFHHTYTIIHPFTDGNGRSGRAIMNRQLMHFNLPFFYIDLNTKDLYYDALELCDSEKDYSNLFIYFMKRVIVTYNKIICSD